jgi:uncharacterized protein YgbK (DUF1537 family)
VESHGRAIPTWPAAGAIVRPRLLAVHLVQLAAIVLRRAEIGRVCAEGGATAVALVRRMGWRRLSVLRECAPGVATLAVEGGGPLLTIKPGSYSWPAEFRTKKRYATAK